MDAAKTSNVTDDQELAKVLESMNQQAAASTPVVPPLDEESTAPVEQKSETDGLSFEETPVTAEETPAEPVVIPDTAAVDQTPVEEPLAPVVASNSPELDAIKKDALEELRPLVDKLDLPADEKFDTLLLLIRSTDDKTLVSAAHDAAKDITDETKRAQALLDVIKEIDYFSAQK